MNTSSSQFPMTSHDGLFGPISPAISSDSVVSTLFSTRTNSEDAKLPPMSLFQSDDKPASVSMFSTSSPGSGSLPVLQPPEQSQVQPSVPEKKTILTQESTNALTQKDLEAFKADKFILGKIPEHAPPLELC